MEFRESFLEKLNTPHLLVIGGTGFIGHHLLKISQTKGWKLTSFSMSPPSPERYVKNVKYLHFDLSNRNLVKKNLDIDYDYVVNLGGYINHLLFKEGGRKVIETHFTALQNLLEFLPRQKLKRFVHIGSSDEYGRAPAPQKEKFRENPISPYSSAKVACTHFLQMLHCTENFPVVILRFFLTYGPGQDHMRFLPQVIQASLNNEKFPVSSGEQLRDFCYVSDCVNAILKTLIATNVDGEIINIASGKPISIRGIIEKVCSITGSGIPQYGKISHRPGENMELYANISKAKKLLKWEPLTPLENGIKKVIDSLNG